MDALARLQKNKLEYAILDHLQYIINMDPRE